MAQPVESEVATDLVHRIRQGDSAAEVELVKRYGRGLYFMLRRICRPPELVEDLHQEAFQVILERLRGKGLDEPAKLGEFLRGTARNLALIELRRKVRRSTETLDTVEEPVERGATPLDQVVVEERLRLVHRLISELRPERDRQILYRFYIAEEDKEDICNDLDLSAVHFNRVLCRARQRFKDLLVRFEKRQRFRESMTVHPLVFGFLLLGLFSERPIPGREASDLAPVLRPEVPIERQLNGGEAHFYQVELPTGPFKEGRGKKRGHPWLVTVEQGGIDVVLAAQAPDGRRLGPVDTPTYRHLTEALILSTEFLSAEGEAGGRVEVRSPNPRVGPGRYTIRIRELPGETAANRQYLAAETAMSEAARLYFRTVHRDQESSEKPLAELRREAVAKYEEALWHWRVLGRRRDEARALFSLARLASEVGRPERALKLYTAALERWRELGEGLSEAMTLSDMGWTHWKLGDNAAAGDRLGEALFLQKHLGNRYGEAIARNNLCLRAHSQGRLPKALECYSTVLELFRELGELGHEAVSLSNLGNAYRSLGEPEPALEHHRRALALRRATGERTGEARTLNNLAVVHADLGETQEALDHYSQALKIFRETGERRWEARTLSNLGVAYLNLGEPRRASAFLRQALPMRRETGDRRGEVATLNQLGHARSLLEEFVAAQVHHRQALKLARELGNRREEARALEFLGRVRMEVEDFSQAHTFFEEALVVVRAMRGRLREGEILHWKGEAETALGKPEQALLSLAQALELHRARGDRDGESRTLRALARADRRLGRVRSARLRLEEALGILESVRARVLAPKLRAAVLVSHRETYELLIDTLMELHAEKPKQGHDRTALEVSERARARTLLELLEEAGVDFGEVDPALLERRRSLERRLSAKVTRQLDLFSREHTDEERAALEAERYELRGELEKVEVQIRRASPRHAALNPARTLYSGEIQALLDPDTVLLEYALAETRSFLWRVSTDSVASFELPARDEVEDAALRVHEAFSTLDLRAAKSDRQAAVALSRLLLGPVADELADQRLVIVADGALHYIAFAALPPPSGVGWLLERHEVVHLPSASTLAIQRREPANRAALKWAAVLGDPIFGRRDPRVQTREPPGPGVAVERQTRGPGLDGLDRLPSTRLEAEAIAALAPPEEILTMLGFDASRSRVLGGELRDYRIVHFATHGLINARDPELSGLVLSLLDENGRPRDGFLRLHDIYNLELGAELVVLSGCQTALGQQVLGEGLWGLTRGFLDVGVPRVVASLWRVEDRATAELMARFYRAMRVTGLRPAAALRQAQLELLGQRQWHDPYYWATFLLQGDWR